MGRLRTAYDFGYKSETFIFATKYTVFNKFQQKKAGLIVKNILFVKNVRLIAKMITFLVYVRSRLLFEVDPFYGILRFKVQYDCLNPPKN